MIWDDDKDRVLRAMYAKEQSYSEIGEVLGISRNAVAGRCQRIGLVRKPIRRDPMQTPWTDEETQTAIDLWKSGLSASQISRRLPTKRSRNAVISLLFRRGLTSAHGGAGKSVRKSHIRKPSPLDSLPVEPLPKEDIPPDNLVHLLDTEPHHCRWIYGEPSAGQCCGRTPVIGLPYCIDHARRAFVPAQVKPKPVWVPFKHLEKVFG